MKKMLASQNLARNSSDSNLEEGETIEQAKNFEITNKYLLYRQEVLAQSMGGLNIY